MEKFSSIPGTNKSLRLSAPIGEVPRCSPHAIVLAVLFPSCNAFDFSAEQPEQDVVGLLIKNAIISADCLEHWART